LRFVWDRGIGTPVKMTGDVVQRAPLIFISPTGYLPYDSRHPANKEIDARSRQINVENDAKLAIEAAERAAPLVLESEPTKGDPDAETLEIVRDDLPQDFTPGGSR